MRPNNSQNQKTLETHDLFYPEQLPRKINEKLQVLKDLLSGKKVIIAFSGGVDSTLLAFLSKKFAKEVLLVTIENELLSPEEKIELKKIQAVLGLPLKMMRVDQLSNPYFIRNDSNRCYFCKKLIMSELEKVRIQKHYDLILEGTNYSDLSEPRPGYKAILEANAVSPFVEAKITKQEIRELSKAFGLPTWNKPPTPCTASRFLTGTKITKEGIRKIQEAEKFLKDMFGFEIIRVRYDGEKAIIQALKKDFPIIFDKENQEKIRMRLKEIGFGEIVFSKTPYTRPSQGIT